jgi:hypothetical protein
LLVAIDVPVHCACWLRLPLLLAVAVLQVDVRFACCNLPPHTIMRGPGFLQAVMVMEQVGVQVELHAEHLHNTQQCLAIALL